MVRAEYRTADRDGGPAQRAARPGTESAPPIRVVVAGEHTLFREGIAEILSAEKDLEVVAQAGNGPGALASAVRTNPDVVLLDVEAPRPEPTELLTKVLAAPSAPRVILLGMHDDARLIGRLVALGLHAYISKSATREQLLSAVRATNKDREHVVLAVSKHTMTQLGQPAPELLSTRQLDVLTLVRQGLSNAQIADRLRISEGTVKRHLTNIYIRLDVGSRMNAINKANELRLL